MNPPTDELTRIDFTGLNKIPICEIRAISGS